MSTMKGPGKVLLICCGSICLVLGVLGILLPILPTTPFLLLAAACYSRSSQRFHDWLITNRLCGAYIRNYREGRGIPRAQKMLTLALLWLVIGFTAWQATTQWWLRLLLCGIAAGVSVHLIKMKTSRPEASPCSPASAPRPPRRAPSARR